MSNWTFEPGHTQARFRARHMMVTYVDGLIKDVHGRVHWDPERPEATRFEATLDLATLWTGVEARDNHLKSGDFFDVENHPKITFESKAVKTLSATELRVEGNLTMRGVTKPVVLEASYVGSWNTPYWESKAGE